MKTIKQLMMFLALALTFTTAFAQNVATKELLCKKWVIDEESMKPQILKMIKENPMAAGASEADLQSGLSMAMEQLSGTKMEYKTDGTSIKSSKTATTTGTWSLSADGKQLTAKSEGKPDRLFTFAEITKTKLILVSPDGKNVIFKLEIGL